MSNIHKKLPSMRMMVMIWVYTKFLMTKFMTFAIVMVLMCKPK